MVPKRILSPSPSSLLRLEREGEGEIKLDFYDLLLSFSFHLGMIISYVQRINEELFLCLTNSI